MCECNQVNQVHYEENWNWNPNPKPNIIQTRPEPNPNVNLYVWFSISISNQNYKKRSCYRETATWLTVNWMPKNDLVKQINVC